MTSATGARVPLRGYERFMAIADHSNSKIVHAMVLRASTDVCLAFLAQLPLAVAQTFNRHPRMRATQVRGEFALAEIQPQVTLADVATRKLLDVSVVAQDTERWEQFAERECAAPLDRYAELPYYVRAWHDSENGIVRLMVFSDHYMSDGISGLIVLNDIVTFAAALTQQTSGSPDSSNAASLSELPLRPSLYDMWLAPHPWRLRLCHWAVALFGKAIFKHEAKRFTPVLMPRSDQADFAVPIRVNSSSALFGQGTPETMRKALARCKAERVTFFGALAASVVLAYAVASGQHELQTPTSGSSSKRKPFTLGLDVDFNMRKRIVTPVDEDHVGTYMAMNPLASLAKHGVDLDATAFWDLARACKQELDASFASTSMPLTLLFLDRNIHSDISPALVQDLPIPHSVSADVNVSNIGKYPFALTHDVSMVDGNEPMQIESVHVYNSNPHLGPGAIVYVTATDRLNYSMMHKYDAPVAHKLFSAYVASLELVSEIASDESMMRVAARVVERIKDKEDGGRVRIKESAAAATIA